jgi:hypothetical protein
VICLTIYRASVTIGPAIRGHVYSFDPIPETTYSTPDEPAQGEPPLVFRTMDCARLFVEIPSNAHIRTLYEGIKFLQAPEDPMVLMDAAAVYERATRAEGGFALVSQPKARTT